MSRLATLVTCLSLAGCSAAPVSPVPSAPSAEPLAVAEIDALFLLAPGAVATVKSTSLKVRFLSVTEDSRCPFDATCVWQGEVKLLFEIDDAKSRTQIELRELDSTLVGAHRLTLVDVEPEAVS